MLIYFWLLLFLTISFSYARCPYQITLNPDPYTTPIQYREINFNDNANKTHSISDSTTNNYKNKSEYTLIDDTKQCENNFAQFSAVKNLDLPTCSDNISVLLVQPHAILPNGTNV